MHRQSLGWSVGKLLNHGEGPKERSLTVEHLNRLNHFCSSSSSIVVFDEDDNQKASKPHRFSFSTSTSAKPEKFVHVIPVLTLLCFLILYVCAHTPSQSDLAQFRGFKSSLQYADSSKIRGVVKPFSELQRAKLVEIPSLRNLQGIGSNIRTSRSHRKMANFEVY